MIQMNIIGSDFQKGFVKIKINLNDDLWYLDNVLETGDVIKSKTLRSLFLEREGKQEKIGKKPMILSIRLEKSEFHKTSNTLRLMGKIIEGPEEVQKGSYHTIEVKLGTILAIYKKEWKPYQIDKIKKAQTKVPEVLIAVADMDQATFGILKRSGIEIVSEIRNPYSIRFEEEKLQEFYKKVASEIDRLSKDMKKIILAGPGFAKEHVQKIINDGFPDVKNKIIMDSVSSATKSGINEVMKRGTLDKVIEESEIVKESQIIQKFFIHLHKDDGIGLYGLKELEEADSAGAIEILLVSEEKIREKEIEKLAQSVEKKKGHTEIISKNHELGEQFCRMGGLGAILRFRIY
jgi:protein pelota